MEASRIVIFSIFNNILSKIEILEMGIPFCKNQGFLNFPPATSQIGNSFSKTFVIIVECCSSDEPLKTFFHIHFLL